MKYNAAKASSFSKSDSYIILFYIAFMMLAQEFILEALMLTPWLAGFMQDNAYSVALILQLIYYLPLLVYIGKRGVKVSSALGLRRFKFKDLLITIILSIAGYIVAVAIVSITQTVINLLGGEDLGRLMEKQLKSTPALVLFLGISVMPALFEEISFRGVFLGGMMKDGVKKAILFSALFFALGHGTPIQLPNTFFLGIVMAIIYVYTDSLWLSMIYHFMHNTLALWGGVDKYVLSLPETLGHPDSSGVFSIGIVAVSAVILVSGLYLLSRRTPRVIREQSELPTPEPRGLHRQDYTQAVFAVAIVLMCLRFLLGCVGTFLLPLIQ